MLIQLLFNMSIGAFCAWLEVLMVSRVWLLINCEKVLNTFYEGWFKKEKNDNHTICESSEITGQTF